jgi:preprotein translocase subunit YajC
VVTQGGLYGKITAVSEEYLQVQLADNVEVKLQRGAVTSLLPKGTIKSL